MVLDISYRQIAITATLIIMHGRIRYINHNMPLYHNLLVLCINWHERFMMVTCQTQVTKRISGLGLAVLDLKVIVQLMKLLKLPNQ